MKITKIFLISNIAISGICFAGEIITNPLAGGFENGTTYVKWYVDINHDGVNDLLLGQKENSDDKSNDPFPNEQPFGVYIGQPSGGYVNSQHVNTPSGDFATGINIDITQCYVGYVSEASSYGIVTTQSTWEKKTDTTTVQVVCYTVDGDHMKETYLGGVMDPQNPNIYYNKYLSPSHRTTPQLQEFTP